MRPRDTDQVAKQTMPRSRSISTICCKTTLCDIMRHIVSAIANCCEIILEVKAIMTSHRKGLSRRSSAELVDIGI